MSHSNSFPSCEFWKPFLHDFGASFLKVNLQEEGWVQGLPPVQLVLGPHPSPPSSIVHSRFPFACLGNLYLSGCGYFTCLIVANISIKRPLCGSAGENNISPHLREHYLYFLSMNRIMTTVMAVTLFLLVFQLRMHKGTGYEPRAIFKRLIHYWELLGRAQNPRAMHCGIPYSMLARIYWASFLPQSPLIYRGWQILYTKQQGPFTRAWSCCRILSWCLLCHLICGSVQYSQRWTVLPPKSQRSTGIVFPSSW